MTSENPAAPASAPTTISPIPATPSPVEKIPHVAPGKVAAAAAETPAPAAPAEEVPDFLTFIETQTIPFLDMADLPEVEMVNKIRAAKMSEEVLVKKIMLARAFLALHGEYAAFSKDEVLAKSVREYQGKMNVVVKRLGL